MTDILGGMAGFSGGFLKKEKKENERRMLSCCGEDFEEKGSADALLGWFTQSFEVLDGLPTLHRELAVGTIVSSDALCVFLLRKNPEERRPGVSMPEICSRLRPPIV